LKRWIHCITASAPLSFDFVSRCWNNTLSGLAAEAIAGQKYSELFDKDKNYAKPTHRFIQLGWTHGSAFAPKIGATGANIFAPEHPPLPSFPLHRWIQIFKDVRPSLRTLSPWNSHERGVETKNSTPIEWEYMKSSKVGHTHVVVFSTPTSRMLNSHSWCVNSTTGMGIQLSRVGRKRRLQQG